VNPKSMAARAWAVKGRSEERVRTGEERQAKSGRREREASGARKGATAMRAREGASLAREGGDGETPAMAPPAQWRGTAAQQPSAERRATSGRAAESIWQEMMMRAVCCDGVPGF
jgi:hypothetical protein